MNITDIDDKVRAYKVNLSDTSSKVHSMLFLLLGVSYACYL